MQRGRWCCCLSAGKHAMADCRGRLYRCGDIFDHRATDSLFLGAVRENVRFHQKYNPVYRRMRKDLPQTAWNGLKICTVSRRFPPHFSSAIRFGPWIRAAWRCGQPPPALGDW